MTAEATVFLVDDQAAVLKALSRLLKSAELTVQTFETAQAFLDSGNASQAGCLVLDLAMPGINGTELHRKLIEMQSDLPVIFLTGHGDIHASVQAMKSGALDFLTKPVDDAQLLAAIQLAFQRNQQARAVRTERQEVQDLLATLTPREREVMTQIIEGKLNKQVADELGTVEKTVKVHRARVMSKMQVRSLPALIRLLDKLPD